MSLKRIFAGFLKKQSHKIPVGPGFSAVPSKLVDLAWLNMQNQNEVVLCGRLPRAVRPRFDMNPNLPGVYGIPRSNGSGEPSAQIDSGSVRPMDRIDSLSENQERPYSGCRLGRQMRVGSSHAKASGPLQVCYLF